MNGRASAATVFCGIDLFELETSHENVTGVAFNAGDVIYNEGDDGDRIYLIADGTVRIGRRYGDGRECLLAVVGPSEVFGEESVLDPAPRNACATALTDMQGTALDRTTLMWLMAMNPDIAERFLRVLARRIRWTSSNITDAVNADVAARVAKHLLSLAQRFGVQDGGSTRVPMDLTQEQFAHLVGTSRESVNQALREFKERGWISAGRDDILIHDSEPLVSRAQGARRRMR
ncbi:Crp/Fnr family transcriptional regulator [Mycolicibacterium mengxianglii]|uniref:Crp/Fnr family transcriptional regulator n=1 Tax=Mycolicibacterium mengxianglii TaxID=2736649 RepID=UPI0018EF0B4F|nr:Crp/Fnr family transcriptional regulator [Mycolicibacterium mengxianglii]